jgi:hypothetical protein
MQDKEHEECLANQEARKNAAHKTHPHRSHQPDDEKIKSDADEEDEKKKREDEEEDDDEDAAGNWMQFGV